MRPDTDELFTDLLAIGLPHWREALKPVIASRFAGTAHGDLGHWRAIIDTLPAVRDAVVQADRNAVTISSARISSKETSHIAAQLKELMPWRKGPFRIFGIDIDAEWRSDLKWNRLKGSISSLEGRNILDVGCGNGYYALRMKGSGASRVIGVDPGLLHVCQFLALKKMAAIDHVHVLPLRLEDLPAAAADFDTTFSMGVLYHRRNPVEHLQALKKTLRQGGELVLETLVLPGDGDAVIEPEARYARMRNVWHLPSVSTLLGWLASAGFGNATLVNMERTTTAEQRTTAWMPFESLAEALAPGNPRLTVEGLPAPTRAVIISRAD